VSGRRGPGVSLHRDRVLSIFEETDQLDLSDRMYASLGQILAPDEHESIIPDWRDIAHEFQIPPTDEWWIWALVSGRGAGKTRAASELTIEKILSGEVRNPGLIAPTASDARRIMVSGPAGLIAIASLRGLVAVHEPSKSRVVFPELNVVADIFSAETPERLRGPQHDWLWMEEVGAWQDAYKGDVEETTWNNAMLGLRMGDAAQAIVTSTPKPNKLMQHIFELAKKGDIVITTGSTYANRANLSKNFFKQVVERYEGTRLGRQEIYGELLEDIEGALWKREWIDATRIHKGEWWKTWRDDYIGNKGIPPPPPEPPLPSNLSLPVPEMQRKNARRDQWLKQERSRSPLPDFLRVVIGIDPNTTSNPQADEAGIVVVALGVDGHAYVLDDRSGIMGPTDWAKAALDSYHYWLADKLVAERNNGGEMVKITLEQVDYRPTVWMHRAIPPPSMVNIELVWASRGKVTRAEPAAALYEQGKVHHVGELKLLEDQLVTYTPGQSMSPGRLDALVWCLTDLYDLRISRDIEQDRRLRVFH
jgi:phage terminase large subunit-like protein